MLNDSDLDLLRKDLTRRLGHRVVCEITDTKSGACICDRLTSATVDHLGEWTVRPYLRPMSSMTHEERSEIERESRLVLDDLYVYTCDSRDIVHLEQILKYIDALIDKNFDLYGLIDRGLALPMDNLLNQPDLSEVEF